MLKRYNGTIAAALFFILLTLGTSFHFYIPKSFASTEEVIVIPREAIRLRILANSNSEADQRVKRKIRDLVNEQITEWVIDLDNLEEAREKITGQLDKIERIALGVLEDEGINQDIQVDFGHINFPTKLYGQFLYPAGSYEAILITIGEGKGANWWCVLFPPLCFLDFSSGSAVSHGFEDGGGDESEEQKQDDGDSGSNSGKNGGMNGNFESDSDPGSGKKSNNNGNFESGSDPGSGKKSNNNGNFESGSDPGSGKKGDNLYLEEDEEEVKVKFFIVEIIKKIFSFIK